MAAAKADLAALKADKAKVIQDLGAEYETPHSRLTSKLARIKARF